MSDVVNVLLGGLVGNAIAQPIVWRFLRRGASASAPPTDNTALVAEALSKAVTQAAEAIGKAAQTAQAPAPEPPRVVRRVWRDDPDIESGIVDAFDPTDADGWLSPERPTVAFVDDGELERMMQRGSLPD